jgi:hypothetical protein
VDGQSSPDSPLGAAKTSGGESFDLVGMPLVQDPAVSYMMFFVKGLQMWNETPRNGAFIEDLNLPCP